VRKGFTTSTVITRMFLRVEQFVSSGEKLNHIGVLPDYRQPSLYIMFVCVGVFVYPVAVDITKMICDRGGGSHARLVRCI